MKIFIIHARRTGYGVIRALSHEPGASFYVADTEETAVFKSKYIENSFIIKDITKVSNEEFISEMIELAIRMDYQTEKPIVFTGKDDYLIFFSKNFEKLSKYFDLSFETDFYKLNRALSKFELIECAKNASILIPQTFTNRSNVKDILAKCKFPLIVKPAIKNLPELDVVNAAFRIKKCSNTSEFEDAISLLNSLNVDFVVQEFIQGGDENLFTIGTYSHKGKLIAWSTSKKLRQFPPITGECSLGETCFDDTLVPLASRLLQEIGLSGISQIEFKKYNGEYYLIEINPRIWSWHQIHEKVGVNLALIAANSVKGRIPNDMIIPFKGKNGIKKWMFLTMDYMYNNMLNKNVSKIKILKDFLRCDLEAFFHWKDLSPFIRHLKRTIPYIISLKKNSKKDNI